jgi:hypothetical protein
MIRFFVTAAAMAAISLLSSGSLAAQQPPAASGHRHEMTLPKPVNLKVLPKDTSPQDLMKIMHGYTQSLGVHCNFCHVINEQTHHPDFASDEKPEKNTARTMITMTNEINEKYMSQIHDPDAAPDQKTVQCSTCHRGHSMPMPFKAPPEHEGHEHPAPPAKP